MSNLDTAIFFKLDNGFFELPQNGRRFSFFPRLHVCMYLIYRS